MAGNSQRKGAIRARVMRRSLSFILSPDCDLQLQDPLASRHHVALEQNETGWRMVDLDSTNGTRLNGQLADEAELKDGDVVQLGESIFRVRLWSGEQE